MTNISSVLSVWLSHDDCLVALKQTPVMCMCHQSSMLLTAHSQQAPYQKPSLNKLFALELSSSNENQIKLMPLTETFFSGFLVRPTQLILLPSIST
jgi:hypothetical protein